MQFDRSLCIIRIKDKIRYDTIDGVSEELKAFWDHVAEKMPKNFYVEKLEEAVKKAKTNREWRHEYMTLLMRDQENQEIGEKRGEERLAQLIMLLNEAGRSSDTVKILQHKEYRQKPYAGISHYLKNCVQNPDDGD